MKAKGTSPQTQTPQAVIYCRVSSLAQVQKGHGLGSQETRCREYARREGYPVAQVFKDEGVSGGMIDRPGILSMLAYLRHASKIAPQVVVIDDISRLARDLLAHIELRTAIAATGATLESPSIEFGTSSDAQLVEYLLATVSQHGRQKNAEQTKNRMVARFEAGFWPFSAPVAYRHEQTRGQGKMLVRNEPMASVVQEALEGFASGHFQTQAEVRRFIEGHPDYPKSKTGRVPNSLVPDLLTNPIYAGYVERPDWGISLRKGQHDGLIDLATFERIQARLKGGSRLPARPDVSSDFPLRGAVTCACCSRPMTSCWSTSKTGTKHAYYYCVTKGCERRSKSIRRDKLEGEFVALLDTLTPAPTLFALVRDMFSDAWNQRLAQARALALSYERELARVEKQISGLIDRIMKASNDTVIAAYEKQITELERSKLVLAEKSEKGTAPKGTVEDLFELAFGFLANPTKLWASGKIEWQKLVLKLAFTDHLEYCPEMGFRTPKKSLPFNMLGGEKMLKNKMAGREGFEPPEGLHLRRFSRPEQSTALPPARRAAFSESKGFCPVRRRAPGIGKDPMLVYCLGKTFSGSPKHEPQGIRCVADAADETGGGPAWADHSYLGQDQGSGPARWACLARGCQLQHRFRGHAKAVLGDARRDRSLYRWAGGGRRVSPAAGGGKAASPRQCHNPLFKT